MLKYIQILRYLVQAGGVWTEPPMDAVPVPGGLRPVRRQVRQQQRLVRDLGRAGGVQE